MIEEFYPGARRMVFDSRLFVDDKKTPISTTMKPATVVCRYGKVASYYGGNIYDGYDIQLGPYEDLVDVVFDHRPEKVSHGHFTSGTKPIQEEGK